MPTPWDTYHRLKGMLPSAAQLPKLTPYQGGESYVLTDIEHEYVWTGHGWVDIGEYRLPREPEGSRVIAMGDLSPTQQQRMKAQQAASQSGPQGSGLPGTLNDIYDWLGPRVLFAPLSGRAYRITAHLTLDVSIASVTTVSVVLGVFRESYNPDTQAADWQAQALVYTTATTFVVNLKAGVGLVIPYVTLAPQPLAALCFVQDPPGAGTVVEGPGLTLVMVEDVGRGTFPQSGWR